MLSEIVPTFIKESMVFLTIPLRSLIKLTIHLKTVLIYRPLSQFQRCLKE
jgi:hypothetical protein